MSLNNDLKAYFGEQAYSISKSGPVLTIDPLRVMESMKSLKNKFSFILLLDICAIDSSKISEEVTDRFQVIYHLLNLENHVRLRVVVSVSEQETLPSVKGLWKTASWFEKEAWDLMGIDFKDVKKERLLNHSQFVGHPLRKDFDTDTRQPYFGDSIAMSKTDKISFTPKRFGNQGPLKLELSLKGDDILAVNPLAGLMHRGIEKIAESMDFHKFIPITNYLNFSSSSMNTIGWCKAVEEMLDIEIPDRAKALRMVFAEMSRIVDHTLCIASMAESTGALTYQWFCFEIRERIVSLFEEFCGSRVSLSIDRIGGLSRDLPLGWVSKCLETVSVLELKINEIESVLSRSSLWMSRTNTCPVKASSAIEWGYTGPSLRACGVNYDIRKVSPYYFYGEIDFDIPLGIDGTTYDRYLVRLEEMKQSLKVVSQVLDNVPVGPIITEELNFFGSGEEYKQKKIDFIKEGIKVSKQDHYSFTESANGELGFYIVADGSRNPYRVKVRAPSFPVYQSIEEVAVGANIVDIGVTLDSFNISPSEFDR